MASAIQEKIQQLKSRVQTGPVGQFFAWWIEELRLALPEPWQRKLQHAMRRVALQYRDGALVLLADENRRLTDLDDLPASLDTRVQRQQAEDLLERNDLDEAPCFLLLDSERFLVREVSLPMAAETNLRQVLTFEMDRQTPFRASAVYFDWKVLERGAAGGQLRLQLFVIPRGEVDAAVREIEARGFRLSGIDVREGDSSLGLNLLPPEQRHKVINRKARANLALAGVVVVLLGLAMTMSLYLRAHQVAELEDAIAGVRGEANQVARIRSQIENATEAAGFLAMRRAESPLAVELLADITRILPDDTYLTRLVIGKTNVQLQGQSENAQQLIELVNDSDYMEAAAFRGSTRLDARTGLEIFEISAQITNPSGGANVAGS
ncbi:MAG: PilN domain-containing protein [Xanthomonadales bacterium]